MRVAYCTNVHPAEEAETLLAHLRSVREGLDRTGRTGEVGIGLWLPDRLTRELLAGDALSRFAEEMAGLGFRPITANAFPFGGFHEREVREAVFRPPWGDPARTEQTVRAAEVLARLLPEGAEAHVSTLPLGAATAGFRPGDEEAAAAELVRACGRLERLFEETGRRIVLALEAEPRAWLETSAEAARFLDERVLSSERLRRFVGLCVDACHEAVEFVAPDQAFREAARRAVRVAKVQVTCALEAPLRAGAGLAERLRAFDEGRYLHQATFAATGGRRLRFSDLGPALAFLSAGAAAPFERVRFHFHVPVHAEPEAPLRTTRDHLEATLAAALEHGVNAFEVETYTFSVLPRGVVEETLPEAIARELAWTEEALARAPRRARS